MTRPLALAVAACLAASPSGAEDGWRITANIGFDPQIRAAEDAYRAFRFGGGGNGGGGNTGARRAFRLNHAFLFELRATRHFDLPAGLTGELSGAATMRQAKGRFPEGLGILVDRIDVRSSGYGFDARAALSAPWVVGTVTSGAGYSWTQAKDKFEYGILTIYEKRTTALPYGFVKARAPVFGSSAIAYVEAQTSRLGVNLGFGVEHEF